MELNAETVKKALDWLDSLVGNSNDSDMAMFTYQLLGILYDTCEELTEENERLKSVEFTCGFIKPHKVLQCPIFDEIERTKADTVRKMQEKLKIHFGTYVLGYKIPLTETLKIIDQIAKEMLKGNPTGSETCVVCGDSIPEGRQVCPKCEVTL